jgi:transcriptional regulator with XRE-family HTH domain
MGDRLQKAREVTGLNTREFADAIGVSQKTVTDAENDRRQPRRIMLNAWSLATGVPREWLETGEVSDGDSGPNDGLNVNTGSRHPRTGV